MAEEVDKTASIHHTYPLCKFSDMPEEEMKPEVMDLCVTAAEKHADNYGHAARMLKKSLDKKFGAAFHVVVGESYGFSIIYEEKTMLYMFTGGNIGILIWRA